MKHYLIPARDNAIARSLRNGVPPVDLAEFWGLTEPRIRQIGRAAGLDMRALAASRRDRLSTVADAQWKPSPEAASVLASIDWDLDTKVARRPRCSERDARLLETAVLNDLTLAQIGERFGITRERARQVIVKHTGLNTRDLSVYREQMREASRIANGTIKAHRFAEENSTATTSEVARASGLTTAEVNDLLGAEELVLRRRRNEWTTAIADEDVFAEIRRVAALPGGVPLSGPFYDRNRRQGAVSAARITQRYGTWTTGCLQAGVEPQMSVRANYTRRWTDENLADWAVHYLDAAGMFATYAGFRDWLRDRKHHGAPSAETIRNALGTWLDIVEMAAVRRREIAEGSQSSVPVPPEDATAVADRYEPEEQAG